MKHSKLHLSAYYVCMTFVEDYDSMASLVGVQLYNIS